MVAAEGVNFGDVRTKALYDRTPEQRAAYGRHMLLLVARGITPSHPDFDLEIGVVLHGDFLRQVQQAVAQRAEDLHEAALDFEQLPAGARGDLVYEDEARAQITAELAVLHAQLPLPMIERLSHA